nr:TVP38/TMEM64 family protein [Synechococcus sp. BDU 130192]
MKPANLKGDTNQKTRHRRQPKKLPCWKSFTGLALGAFGVSMLLEVVALSTFFAGMATAASSTSTFVQGIFGTGFDPQAWLLQGLQWIDSLGALGAIAFMVLYVVATVAFLPGSILTLGAGVVFGVALGSIYVFVGATLGAIAAFLVGRYLARQWVSQKIADNPKFRAIDEAVGKEGLKIVLLTRLSPVFPFNLLNYAYGVTGVSLKDYVLGSVGMIPGTIMYVYIGSLAGNLATLGTESTSANPIAQWSIRILGFVATVAVTVYVTKIARQALNKTVTDLK